MRKTKTNPGETLIAKSQWDQRKKFELDRVLDLNKSLIEKYGNQRGWKLGLRFNESDDKTLDYKEAISYQRNGTPNALYS